MSSDVWVYLIFIGVFVIIAIISLFTWEDGVDRWKKVLET